MLEADRESFRALYIVALSTTSYRLSIVSRVFVVRFGVLVIVLLLLFVLVNVVSGHSGPSELVLRSRDSREPSRVRLQSDIGTVGSCPFVSCQKEGS